MTKLLILCTVILVIFVGVLSYLKPGQWRIVTVAEMTETTDSVTAEREIRAILEKYYEIGRSNDHEALKSLARKFPLPNINTLAK